MGSGFSKLFRNFPRMISPARCIWKPPMGTVAEGRIGSVARVDVDELHDPVGVGSGGRDEELGEDRAGDGEVLR